MHSTAVDFTYRIGIHQCPGPSGDTDPTQGIATDDKVPAFAYSVLNAYSYVRQYKTPHVYVLFSLDVFNTPNPKQFATRGKSYEF